MKKIDTPTVSKEKLAKLGKWYVSEWKEWICHLNISLEDFKDKFLSLVKVSQEQVMFREGHLPFSK